MPSLPARKDGGPTEWLHLTAEEAESLAAQLIDAAQRDQRATPLSEANRSAAICSPESASWHVAKRSWTPRSPGP